MASLVSRVWQFHNLTGCDFTVIYPIFKKSTVILQLFYRDYLTALLYERISFWSLD